MRKSLIYIALIGLFLTACRDESLNPVPVWEPAVHGFGVFDNGATTKAALTANYSKNFPATKQDAATATVPLKIRWVSLDNKLTVSKVEVFIEMIEYYQDADKNDKQASLGKKLVKTISSPAGNRQWNNIAISATEVYNLFKDATVKYDKTNAVKVFENPANPRPTGTWFNGTEDFIVTWVLTTPDGKVFSKFNEDSVCGDPTDLSEASANCRLTFDVNGCESTGDQFTGNWKVVEDGWADYKIGDIIKLTPGPAADEFTVGIFATDINHKDIVVKIKDKLTGSVTVAKQNYGTYTAYLADGDYSASGIGTVNGCTGIIELKLEHSGANTGVIGTFVLKLKR